MRFQISAFCLVGLVGTGLVQANWLQIKDVKVELEAVERAGDRIVIHYELDAPGITEESPAYVFIRFRKSPADSWKLIPATDLSGNGNDIVTHAGQRRIVWWGVGPIEQAALDHYEFRIRAMAMVRVPAGEFSMKSVPGAGYDQSGSARAVSELPLFYLAKHETTVAMYADFLNETGQLGQGWTKGMADTERCGVLRMGETPNYTYVVAEGRGKFPINHISWYDARRFLNWCGLRLPTEAEWEKAYRGGHYLDGDESKARPNPMPEREYPWGNDEPVAGDVHRCNHQGEDDGFVYTAPVGSFPDFNGPYGAADQAGNVAEWTLDWYATTHHADLDGYRVIRGGSWRSIPSGVGAVSGSTTLPLRGGSSIGFRGVRPDTPFKRVHGF